MPEQGGPTTWSGIYFQDRAVVYQLIRMLWDRTLQVDDPVIVVRVEALERVDDIVLTKQSGARVFQSVKEDISRSSAKGTPWARMWNAIYDQRSRGDFDADQDVIEIVFPEKDALRGALDELTKRASTSKNPVELRQRLSREQAQLLDDLEQILRMTDKQALALLGTTRIAFLGDATRLYEQLMTLLWAIYPDDPRVREQLIDALVHLVFAGGELRKKFDLTLIDQWLTERGIQLVEALRCSLKVIREVPGETTRIDAQRFFRGFEATWPSVRDGVPVVRTCYTHRRKVILNQAEKFKSSGNLHAYAIVGPRGVGKTTLAKQIAVDLGSQGYIVAWLDAYPRRLHKGLAQEYRRLAQKQRVHVFAGLGLTVSRTQLSTVGERMLSDLADFLRALGASPRVSLYLTIDSNHYEIVRDDLEEVLGVQPDVITVPLNLDDQEVKSLIQKLYEWGALGRLEGRPEIEIQQIFRRKAHKILMVSLIEATSGVSDKDNFQSILRKEYEDLPASLQMSYPLVAVSHAFNVPIPLSLFCAALEKVPGGGRPPTLEHFRTALRGVLALRDEWVMTRHPLVAKTLCEALTPSEPSPDELEQTLWLPLLTALMKAINEEESAHVSYLQEFAAAKVMSILKIKVDVLATQLSEGKFDNLSAESQAILLNAVARTHQGRGNLAEAISWATKSRNQVWPSTANGADVILGYCHLGTRSRIEALEIAKRVGSQSPNPWHVLHAVRILCKAGEPKQAQETLEIHREKIRHLPRFGQIYGEVLRANVGYESIQKDDNPWVHAAWVRSRLELGQIQPEEAIQRLMQILEQEPNIHRAFTDACHLLFMEKRYDDIIGLCEKLLATAASVKGAGDVRLATLDPTETKSMALATKAWATFRRDGAKAGRSVEALFQESLELKPENAWCHNWRGLFLHATEKVSHIAEQELTEALRLNKKVPPFYRNLARVILEVNVNPFSRERNREVMKLCESGLALCPPESYWNWDGLRAELEAILYCARSLDTQHLPDRLVLIGAFAVDPEDSETGW